MGVMTSSSLPMTCHIIAPYCPFLLIPIRHIMHLICHGMDYHARRSSILTIHSKLHGVMGVILRNSLPMTCHIIAPYSPFLLIPNRTSCIWYAMAWITMLDGHQHSSFTHNCVGSWEWWRVAVYLWHAIELHHIVRFFSFQFDTSCILYAMALMTMLDGHQYSPLTHNCMGSWEWWRVAVYLWPVIELHHIVCFLSF